MAKTKRRRKRKTPSARLAQAITRSLDNQRGDVGGVALLFFGILAGMSLYGDFAGVVGRGVSWLLAGSLGSVAYALPPVLAYTGFLKLRNGEDDRPGGVATGAALTMLGVAGFWHLFGAADSSSLRLDELPELGGILGAGLTWPLERLLSVWGAGLVLAAFTSVGLLVLTDTPISQLAAWGQTAGLGLLAGAAWAAGVIGPMLLAGITASKQGVLQAIAYVRGFKVRPESEAGDEVDGDDSIEDAEFEPVLEIEEEPTGEPETADAKTPVVSLEPSVGVSPSKPRDYQLPKRDMLDTTGPHVVSKRAIDRTIEVLENTLKQFEVDARVTGYTAGPTVTRYEIELGEAVKVNRVVSLHKEIGYALGTGDIRILSPIPGRSALGVEVPNVDRKIVTLGDVLAGEDSPHTLTIGLGQDISGAPVLINLADMPHLLIAGATSSGKSSCVNAMLTSLLVRTSPDDVRLLLVDPKMVELTQYNGVPHLLTPVVTSPKKASEALGWLVREMDNRYEVLAEAGMRSVEMYNDAVKAGMLRSDDGKQTWPYPHIVVVIDELADLMMVAPREVEDSIMRIAQKARAVSIHLVVATQRPSVDVVTGVIKANFPSRIGFMTASASDSRVILDESGADRLIGSGDMLYKHSSAPRPRRIQGAWVTQAEVNKVTAWCRRQRQAEYVEGMFTETLLDGRWTQADDEDEALAAQARELVVRSQLGSTSMLQRKLKVGFSRAGRLMDILEERGVVGPSLGSKPREVLMSVEEFEESLVSATRIPDTPAEFAATPVASAPSVAPRLEPDVDLTEPFEEEATEESDEEGEEEYDDEDEEWEDEEWEDEDDEVPYESAEEDDDNDDSEEGDEEEEGDPSYWKE